METECNRRASQIEAQFQADCEKVTERCAHALQSLEERCRRELKDLLDQHMEERSQWEFEKDELTQECTEAQEQLKELLQREKATALVLSQEREMMEETYKERLSSLSREREQLLRDLEELRSASEKQHSLLSEQIRELREREQGLCQAGASEKLASQQQLERLRAEREQERREMSGRLTALESAHRASCERAEQDKAEMGAEIRRLRDALRDAQQAASLLAFQGGCQAVAGEEEEGDGASSLLEQGEQLLEENGDVLLSLQRAHERAVMENAKMATEISRLQQRLRRLEPGLGPGSSCADERMSETSGSPRGSAEPFLFQTEAGEKAATKYLLRDLGGHEARELGSTGTSSVRRQEGRAEGSEVSLECFSELDNSEDAGTESWAPQSQVLQLQEQLTALRADCSRASERKRDLLFDISVLRKKLKMLGSPGYRSSYEEAVGENARLRDELGRTEARLGESLASNRELSAQVSRLQGEVRGMQEVMDALLILEDSHDSEDHGLRAEELGGPRWGSPAENPGVPSDDEVLELLRTPGECPAAVVGIVGAHRIQEECRMGAREAAWFPGTGQEERGAEEKAALRGLQDTQLQHEATIAELELEKQKLQELTRKLRERVAALVKQRDAPAQGEKEEELKAMMQDLQTTCSEMQRKVELLR